MFDYTATVSRIVDGDTLVAVVDQGLRVYTSQTLRLMTADMRGVQCAELHDHDPATRARAEAAKARVIALLPTGAKIRIHTEKSDDWQRWLASIQLPDGRDLGTLLLEEGLATPYHRASTPPPAAAPAPPTPP